MLCADENFFPWIDICAIQINKYYYYHQFYQKFCYDFRLGEILAECKEGTELKKILNPHFGK